MKYYSFASVSLSPSEIGCLQGKIMRRTHGLRTRNRYRHRPGRTARSRRRSKWWWHYFRWWRRRRFPLRCCLCDRRCRRWTPHDPSADPEYSSRTEGTQDSSAAFPLAYHGSRGSKREVILASHRLLYRPHLRYRHLLCHCRRLHRWLRMCCRWWRTQVRELRHRGSLPVLEVVVTPTSWRTTRKARDFAGTFFYYKYYSNSWHIIIKLYFI